MGSHKLCIHCATGECRWRDGIMCMSWVCARDNQGSDGNPKTTGNGSLDSLFSVFGIKPGDPTYDSLMKGYNQ